MLVLIMQLYSLPHLRTTTPIAIQKMDVTLIAQKIIALVDGKYLEYGINFSQFDVLVGLDEI